MRILYRISSNSYEKHRLSYATKEYCLKNFIENVLTQKDKMLIIADCVTAELSDFLKTLKQNNIEIIEKKLGSNGASFRYQLEYAANLPDDEVILFQEDDYLYKPAKWPYGGTTPYSVLIQEALDFADYVSLYDHPDKYISPEKGGNKYISDLGVENTGVFCSKNSHWKFTNSTTCTFATLSRTISKDIRVWKQFCQSNHPYDFQAFLTLGLKGRKVATPIPGRATHCETEFLSPFFTDTN